MQIEVIALNPMDILLLEENAHYMQPDTYQRLVANVSEDNQLTSTPFVWWNKERDGWECLSGNHRVKAARDADLKEIFCLATRDDLPLEKRVAIQLSHNKLLGLDDPALLKKLYEQVEAIDLKAYTGFTDIELELIKHVPLPALAPINLEFRTITILFLPEEVEAMERIFAEASLFLEGDVWAAKVEDYKIFGEALELVSASYNVKNHAVLFWVLTEMLKRHITELELGWAESQDSTRHWLPIAALTGNAYMPVESAKILQKALDQMTKNKDIGKSNRWQGLEYLAANYLAGEE